MNKRIMQLRNQLKDEADRLADRIATLQQSNLDDHEILNTFIERFTHAVQDEAGEEEIALLESQRNEALKRVEQNESIIKILTSSLGSKTQRLKAELVGELFNSIKEIEEKSALLYKKLEPARETLLEGTKELWKLHEDHLDHLRLIDTINLDREDQLRYGIAEYRECDGQKMIGNNMDRWAVFNFINSLEFNPIRDYEKGRS